MLCSRPRVPSYTAQSRTVRFCRASGGTLPEIHSCLPLGCRPSTIRLTAATIFSPLGQLEQLVGGPKKHNDALAFGSHGQAVHYPQRGNPTHATKVAAVALANKMARIAWVLLMQGGTYRKPATGAA